MFSNRDAEDLGVQEDFPPDEKRVQFGQRLEVVPLQKQIGELK